MNEAILKMLASYECGSKDEVIHAFREILQEVALLGLWRSKFFEHAAFYGGTALRIIYGLDRFSEDLDFSLLQQNTDFDLSSHIRALEIELAGFGFQVSGEIKEKKVDTPVQSAFLKSNTLQVLLAYKVETAITESIHPGQQIKIKLEIDTDPPPGFNVESKYIFRPIPFAVRIYSLPDLFAGKLHALLCRKWKNRVKGRDWYDFVWYCINHPILNVLHLEMRMRQSGHWLEEVPLTLETTKSLITTAINDLNIDQAQKDVRPFLRTPESLEIWSADFFKSLMERIQDK